MTALKIGIASLATRDVQELITLHQRHMHQASPPGTSFALDLSGLESPDITVFEARKDGELLGVGALKKLSSTEGEIKSMRTAENALRMGVGQGLLDRIVATAQDRGYGKLLLETGTGPIFEPANQLYLRNVFTRRGPFEDYVETEFNIFYERSL